MLETSIKRDICGELQVYPGDRHEFKIQNTSVHYPIKKISHESFMKMLKNSPDPQKLCCSPVSDYIPYSTNKKHNTITHSIIKPFKYIEHIIYT